MLLRSCGLALTIALLGGQAVTGATSIQYSLVPLGGNVYRYVYTITNNSVSGGSSIQLFDILFDSTLYQGSSLQIVSPSSLQLDWSQQILSPINPGVPSAYDVLSLRGGIPPGTSVSGFAVQFTWRGTGVPGAQPFQVFDPNTFALLESGQSSSGPSAPAASTLSLVLIGIGLALAAAYQMKTRVAARPWPHVPPRV